MHNLLLLNENMFTVEELPSAQKVSLMFWQSKQNIPSGYCCTCKEGANYICNDGLGVFLFKFMHRHQEAHMAKTESLTLVFHGIMQTKRKLKKKKNAKSHLFSLQGWHAVIYFNHLCSTNSSYRQSEKNNSNNLRENNKKLSIGWLCKVKYKPLVPWMQMKRLDFSIQQVHVSTQSSDHVLIKGEFEKVKFRLSCRNNKSWFCEPSLNVESLKPHRINAKIKPRSGSGSVSWSDTRLENHSSVE